MGHTPGPWWENVTLVMAGPDATGKPFTVAEVSGVHNVDANARLIAAAPDLLRELKFAVSVLRDNHIARGLAAALEAIAKAEGRTDAIS